MSLRLNFSQKGKKMNKLKNFVSRNRNKLAVVGTAIAGLATSAGMAFATGPTADPAIATTADQVGGQFQVNILSALTTILPYVLAVVGIFLAVKLGMRWMKKSAH
jgi:hypothetical protein